MNIGDIVETLNNNGDVLVGEITGVTQEPNSIPRYTVVITKGRFSKEIISKPFTDFILHRAQTVERKSAQHNHERKNHVSS